MRIFFALLFVVSVVVLCCRTGDNSTGSAGIAPQITGFTPAQVNPGQDNVEGRIYGHNLTGVFTVNLGAGVALQQFQSISADELYIFFSVARDATPGPRQIIVTTGAGAANASNLLTVGDNRIPEALFSVSPTFGLKDTIFHFDAKKSNDDGGIVKYKWNFGDHRSGTGKSITHKYEKGGSFEITLEVTDNRNATASTTRFVDVQASRAPLAAFTVSPQSGDTSTNFRFDASASHDPDGRISRYLWGFGDGKTASGKVVQHQFIQGGTFVVSLTVADNSGVPSLAQHPVGVSGPGGGGGPPPTGGQECTVPAIRPHTGLFGTIISADKASSSIVIRLNDNTDCGNAFFRCGDFNNPSETAYFGAICRMFFLGNNTFRVVVINSKAWPNPGDAAFLKYQTCTGSFSCP